jgi:hypothetical protein
MSNIFVSSANNTTLASSTAWGKSFIITMFKFSSSTQQLRFEHSNCIHTTGCKPYKKERVSYKQEQKGSQSGPWGTPYFIFYMTKYASLYLRSFHPIAVFPQIEFYQ